jgi:transposase-like protein
MRPCAASDCTATFTSPVRTRQGTLDVCAAHRGTLEAAGEVIDHPPPLVAITVEDAEARAHREKIRAGIEAAREAGTHVGRKPTPVPEAAVEEVRAGAPLREVARKYGVERNTLRRRADGTVKELEPPAGDDPLRTAHRLLGEAIRLRQEGEAQIVAGQAKLAEAEARQRQVAALLQFTPTGDPP